jgi:hypothetical protein
MNFYNELSYTGQIWTRDSFDNILTLNQKVSSIYEKYKFFNLNFYKELQSNNIISFDVFYDSIFLQTKTGYIFEKYTSNDDTISPYNKINNFNSNKVNNLDYWFDEKNKIVYIFEFTFPETPNIPINPYTNLATIQYAFTFRQFDTKTGEFKNLLKDNIRFYISDYIDFDNTNGITEDPKLTYNSDTELFNASFIIKNTSNSVGLISMNFDKKEIKEVNVYIPFGKVKPYGFIPTPTPTPTTTPPSTPVQTPTPTPTPSRIPPFFVCGYDVNTTSGFNGFKTMMEFDVLTPINGTFSYSCSNLNGMTVVPGESGTTIVLNSEYIIKQSCGNDGSPYVADDSFIFFNNVIKKNFKISYDFYLTDYSDIENCRSGGKHLVVLAKTQNSVTGNKSFQFGSWSSDFSNTVPRISIDPLYDSTCYIEDPLNAWSSIPQSKQTWRRRTFIKNGNTLSLQETGFSAITITRPFISATQGYVGLRIGPSVRIKNVIIEDL